jgi:hypothetical protein
MPMVRSPGFEPGSSAWQADVLAKLDYDRYDWTMDICYMTLIFFSESILGYLGSDFVIIGEADKLIIFQRVFNNFTT